jgi:uncharacterized protein YndB with AHSA1/START domain
MSAIQHEVWIRAGKQVVFDAVTTQQGLDAWWGTALNGAAQVGEVVQFEHGLGEPLRMQVMDVVPAQLVEWECISDFEDPGSPASEWSGHRLRFELETAPTDTRHAWLRERLFAEHPDDEITILRFRHAGWSPDDRWFSFCNTAWGVTLVGIQQHCEAAAN